MSDAAPPPPLTLHEVDMMDAELDVLWRAVFGGEPMPSRRRRALVRLWGAAMTVDWSHVRPKAPRLPVGLVLVPPLDRG